MLMKLLHNGETITLTEAEQTEVYEFYRLHCTMERVADVLSEKDSPKVFKSDQDAEVVARRVLLLMDNYHVPEDTALDTILGDDNYINQYITDENNE